MKRTNNSLYDFLDFNQKAGCEEKLWKACKPSCIKENQSNVYVTIPLQQQICSDQITPDLHTPFMECQLRICCYGEKIIRLTVDNGHKVNDDSPILQVDPSLSVIPLKIEKNEREWIILDVKGNKKACFDLSLPETEFWSDLIPGPSDTLNVTFFPDGKHEVKISAYDQFTPSRQEAFALAFIQENESIQRSVISFYSHPDTCFVGTGERFDRMDLSGKTFQLENQDAQGVNSKRAYKNIPFYLTNHNYGLFIHTSAHSKLSLADHSSRSVQIMVEEPVIDLFLISGNTVEEILYGYRQLTGFPVMPPIWSFGVWMSRMTYFSATEVTEICNRLRKEDYPCDVIHLDTGWFRTDWLCEWKFNPERFPDPQKFIAFLRSKGFRVSLWQLPYIAAEAEQYDEAMKNRFICETTVNDSGNKSNFSVSGYAGTIDFSYQKAVEWYKNLLKDLLSMGIACIKADFGENIHMDAKYHSIEPLQLHNLYALLYQKAVFEITKEITGEGIIWARAGWAGCQRYPVHWGGDAACTWDGMAGTLRGGLHIGLSGFAFWSHDIPGFHGSPDFMNSVIPDDLYVRWTQFGVFTSHMRYHGTSKREPYHFKNIADIVKFWIKLRYCLIPYIIEQSRKATETGYPMLRALIFHHANDNYCWHIDDEYYFGDYFLVAPVMNSSNTRDIYLPSGKWVNLFNGKIAHGKRWLKKYTVSLKEMPVWVKYGAKIPVYPERVKCTDEIDFTKVLNIIFDKSFKGIYHSIIGKILNQ
jgi:alpha-D-xyloside xylohydrolase